jgi:hypothetical protein
MSRRAFTLLIVGAVIGMVAIIAACIVVALTFASPRPTVEAQPGQDTFDLLRITDAEVEYLGLTASDSGHQPSTLATAATTVPTNWRDAKATPPECMFAGAQPARAVFPVWGTEDSSDPLWAEKSISGTQSFASSGTSMIWVTYRTFASDDAALEFLLEHNELVTACTEFTAAVFQGERHTTVTPLTVNTLQASNSGWVAETPQWVVPGYAEETAVDLQTWVLNVQRGEVVAKIVMLVPAEFEADAGPFFTEFAAVVAARMIARISE